MKTKNTLKETLSLSTLFMGALAASVASAEDYNLDIAGGANLTWDSAAWSGGSGTYPQAGDHAIITRAGGNNSFLGLAEGSWTVDRITYTGGANQLRIRNNTSADLANLLVTTGVVVESGNLYFTKTGSGERFNVETASLHIKSGATSRIGMSSAGISFISNQTTIDSGGRLEIGWQPTGALSLGVVQNEGVFDLGGGGVVLNADYQVRASSLAGGGDVTTSANGTGANPRPTLILDGGSGSAVNYSGVISDGTGRVRVEKEGTGIQIFSNANTYSGGSLIRGGVLRVENTAGSGLGSGPIEVASGGTLAGNGMIAATDSIVVQSGGVLAPGAGGGISKLTVDASQTGAEPALLMQEGSSFLFNLASGNISDSIEFTGYSAGDLVLDAPTGIAVNVTGIEEGLYTLFLFKDALGNAVDTGLTDGLMAMNGFDGYQVSFHYNNDAGLSDYGTIMMEVAVIPEPAAVVLLMGLGVLCAVRLHSKNRLSGD